ncbi:MAG: class I SAM-dependent methyltransferase [Crocinitomicaceae bacterium]|nr:class I SAM-dependent methyltransferase [Crocinitomicaceae bacterium]
MKTIANCPVCQHSHYSQVLEVKDHSVSGELFKIVACNNCGLQYTNPVPEEALIGNYYKSDSYVSHSSSKEGLINRVYHVVRWYSLRKKVKLIGKLSAGRNLLDIGAGTGHFLKVAKDKGWRFVGLEPDADARSFAKTSNEVDLLPIEQLHNQIDGQFDVITMWHVLEHVYHLQRDLERIVKLLKEDGCLVVAVPNRLSYDARKYQAFWAAYDVPIHLYHFVPDDMRRIASIHGLVLVNILPMPFDSFYVSMLSEKYKNGNIIRGILTGLKSNWLAKDEFWSSQIYIFKKKKQ